MIGQSATSWWAAAPTGLVALVIVMVPGWVAARLLGVRGLPALALAPAVSVTTVALGGVVSSLIGLDWQPIVLLGWCLLLWIVAAVAGRLLRSVPAPRPRGLGWSLLALAVAATGVLVVYLPVSGRPAAFPQQPDTMFHLGTVQWMLGRGDISSLHGVGFASASGDGFYPAAFHGVVASVVQLTGATVVVSTTMVALVTAAVIWPLGALLLAHVVLGATPAVNLATGVTSVAFSAFPIWLMGYGVLWSNLLGQALLPALLACVVAVVRTRHADTSVRARHADTSVRARHADMSVRTRDPGMSEPTRPLDTPAEAPPESLDRWRALVLLGFGLPGLTLAHPNAAISLAVLMPLVAVDSLLGLAWRWRLDRPRAAAKLVVAVVLGVALFLVAGGLVSYVMTAMRASNPLGPETSIRTAIGEAVFESPRGAPPLYVLGAVVVVGILVLLWRGQGRRWVVAAVVVTAALYVLLSAVDNERTRWVTWPWYNNSPRLAALIVVPAMIAAAAALAAPSEVMARWAARRHRTLGRKRSWVLLTGAPTVLAVAVPAVFVLVTGGYVDQHRDMIDRYFNPSVYRSWATEAELDGLRQLAPHIPQNAVVAANPWDGGTYLYLVSGRQLLFTTVRVHPPGDPALLAERLDDAGTDPLVCAAARREHVSFAITGGRPFSAGTTGWRGYPGVDSVKDSAAFSKVATAGGFTLYELKACASA